jgi:lipopolysaccharide/colanic/teichoic acid biosynthesis glycosyltransferase
MTSSGNTSSRIAGDRIPFWVDLRRAALSYLAWGYGSLVLSFVAYSAYTLFGRANRGALEPFLFTLFGTIVLSWCGGSVHRAYAATYSRDVWPHVAKRVIDFVVSALALMIFAPLFVLTAIAIKITSRGPVFFAQERIGMNTRRFKMYKFRTMVQNAEQLQEQLLPINEMTGPVFKIKEDPRVTSIGRVLRNTSIDELPQLFNVLKGDMSLVGPRALPIRDYHIFTQDWRRRRFSVKPGVTSLWQISGRNAIPFEKWMELDMQYIDTWSLRLDFKILVMTISQFSRSGAPS